jgi:hypothetical protein
MDENNKPGSWLNDLSELIKRKKEENELLQKVRISLELPKPEPGASFDTGPEITDDNVNGDK